MTDLTPEDQAVLDAAEVWATEYTSATLYSGSTIRRGLLDAVIARRKAREPKRCKHCGEPIVLGERLTTLTWVHTTGAQACSPVVTHAEPDDSPAART